MKNKEQLKSVVIYEGSRREANIVESILANVSIDCVLKDYINDTITPRCVSATNFCRVRVLISETDFENAKLIVNEYFKVDNQD